MTIKKDVSEKLILGINEIYHYLIYDACGVGSPNFRFEIIKPHCKGHFATFFRSLQPLKFQ